MASMDAGYSTADIHNVLGFDRDNGQSGSTLQPRCTTSAETMVHILRQVSLTYSERLIR